MSHDLASWRLLAITHREHSVREPLRSDTEGYSWRIGDLKSECHMKGVLCFAELAVTNPVVTAFITFFSYPDGKLLSRAISESCWHRTPCMSARDERVHILRTCHSPFQLLQTGVHYGRLAGPG